MTHTDYPLSVVLTPSTPTSLPPPPPERPNSNSRRGRAHARRLARAPAPLDRGDGTGANDDAADMVTKDGDRDEKRRRGEREARRGCETHERSRGKCAIARGRRPPWTGSVLILIIPPSHPHSPPPPTLKPAPACTPEWHASSSQLGLTGLARIVTGADELGLGLGGPSP